MVESRAAPAPGVVEHRHRHLLLARSAPHNCLARSGYDWMCGKQCERCRCVAVTGTRHVYVTHRMHSAPPQALPSSSTRIGSEPASRRRFDDRATPAHTHHAGGRDRHSYNIAPAWYRLGLEYRVRRMQHTPRKAAWVAPQAQVQAQAGVAPSGSSASPSSSTAVARSLDRCTGHTQAAEPVRTTHPHHHALPPQRHGRGR